MQGLCLAQVQGAGSLQVASTRLFYCHTCISALAAASWQDQAQPFTSVLESDVQSYLVYKEFFAFTECSLSRCFCGSLRLASGV